MRRLYMFDGFKRENKIKRTDSQKQQLKFINEIENNENTMETDWTCFNSYIVPVENTLKKPLHAFNTDDIESLFKNMKTHSKNIKEIVFNLINRYMEWTIDNNIRYESNPMANVNKSKCLFIDDKFIKDKYISVGDLFERIEILKNKELNPQKIIIILLSRYGINGKNYNVLRNLKWKHIDFSNKDIKITDSKTGKEKYKVKFDERLEKWLIKTKEYKINSKYKNEYVIKTDKSEGVVSTGYILGAKNSIDKELGLENISLGNLTRCKMIDDLILIRDEKVLDSNSFKNVVLRYTDYNSRGPCDNLKDFYTIITQDNIIERLSKSKKYTEKDIEDEEFLEGEEIPKIHIERERNKKVIDIAKNRFKNKYGRLFCEICKFDFGKKYGSYGEDFIEGHHKIPISQLKEGDTTKPEDIAILCSNCHKMIHRSKDFLTIEELEEIMRKAEF